MAKKKQTTESDGSFVVYVHLDTGAIVQWEARFKNTKAAKAEVARCGADNAEYQVQQIRSKPFRVEITQKRKLVEVEDAADSETA